MRLRFKAALLTLLSMPALAFTAFAEAPRATVAQGRLQGLEQGDVAAFLDIPYAAPPVGADRWRAPGAPAAWSGVRSAANFGPSCYQGVTPNGFGPWTQEYVTHGEVSEDCLSLNVWTPATKNAKKLPVLVWIHGGGFLSGSGSVPIYDGHNLAERGVVVVTINYRLGVFGFFADPDVTRDANGAPPTNFGLQDQIAALQWIHRNITAFGGDPDKVTIAGQSAGSMAVHLLVTSPMAKGLFKRAIAESGLPSVAPPPSLATAEAAGTAFAQKGDAATLAELKAIPASKLLALSGPGLRFFPVVDGQVVPDSPTTLTAEGRFNDVPMIVGQNADEGSAMASGYGAGDKASFDKLLHDSFGKMADRFSPLYPTGDAAARSVSSKQVMLDKGLGAIWEWSRARVAPGHAPVYVYLYTHVEPGPESKRYGAFHSSEIPYALANLDKSPGRTFTDADRALSNEMSSYWVNFVKTGNPNGSDLTAWPQFREPKLDILEIGDKIRVEPLLPKAKLELIKAFVNQGGALRQF